MHIDVHPRIEQRHPELKPDDVIYAWQNWAVDGTRTEKKDAPRTLRIGYDRRGREIEMIGVQTDRGWLVYHAMTPPSKKTITELEHLRRQR